MPEPSKETVTQRVVASIPMTLAKAKGDGRTMVGYAMTFDQPIMGAGGWFPVERMYLRRGAFKKTIAERFDKIKPLFNHGHDPTIGEKPLGKPEVITEHDYGVWTETPLLDTSWANDVLELIRAGAIDGMSASFEAVDYTFSDDGTSMEVTQARLYEFGPVTFPAGEGTSATLMSASALDAAYHDRARAESPGEGGRLAPPPTLAALTWRLEAQPAMDAAAAEAARLQERMSRIRGSA